MRAISECGEINLKHLPSGLCEGRMGVWEDAPDREVAPATTVQMPFFPLLATLLSPDWANAAVS